MKEEKITHYPIKTSNGIRYICNQACEIIPSKICAMKGRVTCKNCLKILRKNT